MPACRAAAIREARARSGGARLCRGPHPGLVQPRQLFPWRNLTRLWLTHHGDSGLSGALDSFIGMLFHVDEG